MMDMYDLDQAHVGEYCPIMQNLCSHFVSTRTSILLLLKENKGKLSGQKI